MKTLFFNRLLWAGISFIATSAFSSLILAWVFHGLNPWIATLALIIGTMTAGLAWSKISWTSQKCTTADKVLLGIFFLVCLRAMLWVVYSAGGEWRVLSPNNVGDASLHLTFINYLARGTSFWPESPILIGTPLAYPIGSDLFNALLTCIGIPTIRGLVWVGLGCSLLTGIALWRWGSAFVIAAFLFNGGLAGFTFFTSWKFEDYQALLAWKNIFLSMFVTQRGLLYAIPAGLALLISWRSRIKGNQGQAPLWVEAIIYATLPLFNVHAFLVFSLLLAVGVMLPNFRFHAIRLVGYAFIPATFCMAWVTGFFSMPSHIRWRPGWMEGGTTLWFWIHNFGVSLPLWIYVALRLAPIKSPKQNIVIARYFTWTATLIFLAGICIMLTPWEWDNTKVLFWSWIIVAPFLWEFGIAPLPSAGRIILCLLLFTSGAISLIGGLDARHGYRIASRAELDEIAEMLRVVQPSDHIATAPMYNHPVLLLGYKVIAGYEGHLSSHGLDYQESLDAIRELYQTGNADALKNLPDVQWLFFGKEERRAFPDSPLARSFDYLIRIPRDRPIIPPSQ